MFFDDLVNIFFIHIRIPDVFGIDNDNRTFVAAIKTTRIVNPYPPAFAIELEGLDSLLGIITHGLSAMIVTTRGSRLALVYAEKYMSQVVAHNVFNGMRNNESKYYTGTVITSSTAELIGVIAPMACFADTFEERE